MESRRGQAMARRLMRLARWVLPAESRDWAAAMEAELGCAEGSAAALRWAAGCLWVACRERLATMLRGARGEGAVTDLLALEMEAGMRRVAVGILVTAAAAPLLFLLAPSFRQGLAVQARLWTASFNKPLVSAAELRAMASDAQKHGDAETLAFAALLHRDASERAAWADEAVRQKRELTWLYAVLLSRAEYPAEATAWLVALRHWAPNNGVVHAVEANQIAREMGSLGNLDYRQPLTENVQWRGAMQEAFAAPEFASYGRKQFELICAVMRRHGSDDPLLLAGEGSSATYAWLSVKRNLDIHVKEIFAAADGENEQGRHLAAARAYRQVVALGQRIERSAWTRWERVYAAWVQLEGLKPLRAVGEHAGDLSVLDAEIARLETLQRELRAAQQLPAQDAALHSSGLAVQISFLAGCLALMLSLLSGMAWLLLRERAPRMGSLFASAGGLGILALGISSLVFYVSYKPYAGLLEYFLTTPETPREMSSLSAFAGLWSLPLAMWQLWWSRSPQVYFWYVLIAVASTAVIWLLVRNTRAAACGGTAKFVRQ